MIAIALSLLAHAGPFAKNPLPESVIFRRAGWQALPDVDDLAPGHLLAPGPEAWIVVATNCLDGETSEKNLSGELADALAVGVSGTPPPGASWAEGPVPQHLYGSPRARYSKTGASLTEVCIEAAQELDDVVRQSSVVLVGVLDAEVVASGCGRMQPSWKAMRGEVEGCEDRTGERVSLGVQGKSLPVLLPPESAAGGPSVAPWPVPADAPPGLTDPALATDQAPAVFEVRVETTEGDIRVRVQRDWAPEGADRFYNLVKLGFYDGTSFFRVIPGFVAQVGISPFPDVSTAWFEAVISDDSVKQSNTRGRLSFASSGPDSRTTQLFICLDDQPMLDGMGFSPFGEVIDGMEAVDALHDGYGEAAPAGQGPDQGRIQAWGGGLSRVCLPRARPNPTR